ncbi:MAG: DUF1707 domain-containing protein [Nocardiopsaceae bacterium]|nr:DUF1707 domain-containing protein [Nocardiopsaceae bacterium]
MSDDVPAVRIRASHLDRERVIEVLRSAVADGRLDISEFSERTERVYGARMLGELPEITADLVPPEQQPIRVDNRPLAAFFGNLERSGRWVVRASEAVFAVGGDVRLDLRDALLIRNHTRMSASSVFGRIRIDVPEGVEVRLRGWSFLGRRTTSVRRPRGEDAPVLEIEGFSLFGSLTVHAPTRPRNWLPWRRRGRKAVE